MAHKTVFSLGFLVSSSVLLSLLNLANTKAAPVSPLPQPSPTMTQANTSVQSVQEVGTAPATAYPPAIPAVTAMPLISLMPKKTVIEIKSEYITKNDAMAQATSKDHNKFVISYSISHGATLQPEQLSARYFYYLNRKNHQIGVALNKVAAKTLTEAPRDVYCAKQGDTLKNTLTRWAKQGGYKIEWLSDYDYTLKYSYEFPGKLEEKAGPLNQILSSIAGSNYALKAVITKNNVILIKDNDFSPSVLSK